MKKFLVLFMLLALVSCIRAAAPTYAAEDATYELRLDTTFALDDTIADSDSATVCTNFTLEPGYQYVLVRDDFTGETSDDSVNLVLRVFCNNASGTNIYKLDIDSATTIGGEAYLIDLGGSVFAQKVTIKLIALSDLGDAIIMPSMYMWKRRPVNIGKRW